jgi:hypothetical protein
MKEQEVTRPSGVERVPGLIRRLYEVVDELEAIFEGRKFTPDGHLVGSIGEALAAHYFDLELLPGSTEGLDAIPIDKGQTVDGEPVTVQVKATQGTSVSFYSARALATHVLVLRIARGVSPEVIYNGPAKPVWTAAGFPDKGLQKNGQWKMALSRLRELNSTVTEDDRLRAAAQIDEELWR